MTCSSQHVPLQCNNCQKSIPSPVKGTPESCLHCIDIRLLARYILLAAASQQTTAFLGNPSSSAVKLTNRRLALQCGECPGINAFHCEGRGWVLSADEINKIEFRGQYANIRCIFLLSTAAAT